MSSSSSWAIFRTGSSIDALHSQATSSITEINVPQSIICGDGPARPDWRDAVLPGRFSDYNMPLNCLEMRNSFLSYNWIRGSVLLNSFSSSVAATAAAASAPFGGRSSFAVAATTAHSSLDRGHPRLHPSYREGAYRQDAAWDCVMAAAAEPSRDARDAPAAPADRRPALPSARRRHSNHLVIKASPYHNRASHLWWPHTNTAQARPRLW